MDLDKETKSEPVDVTKKERFSKLKNYLKKRPPKKRLIIVSSASLAVLLLGLGYLKFYGPKADSPNPEPEVVSTYVAPPEPIYSPLTGKEVTQDQANRPITGIMIENSVDARPQSGLVDAGVVFEAIAEGGITRFLALFQEAQPDYIGPIRSARPYYVRWAAGFDAGYVHSGGSGEALALIKAIGVKDMDHGVYGNKYFDRVSNRYAPHNVYTSMERLDSLRESLGFTTSNFTPFKRITEADQVDNSTAENASSISFNISSPLYNTSYSYDATTNVYKRTLANAPHNDERSGKQISPSVVVAMIMNYSIHPDGIHSVYDNVGSGKVYIFQNGIVLQGTWEKPTDNASLAFKDSSGNDIQLQPGQTWITAIPDGKLTYSP